MTAENTSAKARAEAYANGMKNCVSRHYEYLRSTGKGAAWCKRVEGFLAGWEARGASEYARGVMAVVHVVDNVDRHLTDEEQREWISSEIRRLVKGGA